MQTLLASGGEPADVNAPDLQTVETIRLLEDPLPPPRRLATAPAPKPTPTTAPLPLPQAPSLPSLDIELPTLAAGPSLPALAAGRPQFGGALSAGVALAGDGGEEGFAGADMVPVASARPKYPRSAIDRKLEGWVELIFVVTGEGRVRDVRILDAEPRGVFEDAAAQAISQWLYQPFYRRGKPVAREATQLFEFRLADVNELYVYDD